MRKTVISILVLVSCLCVWSGIAYAEEVEPENTLDGVAVPIEEPAAVEDILDAAEDSDSDEITVAVQEDVPAVGDQAFTPEPNDSPDPCPEEAEEAPDAGEASPEPASEPVDDVSVETADDAASPLNSENVQPAVETPSAAVAVVSAAPKRAEAAPEPVVEKLSLAKAEITTSKRKLYTGKRIKPKVKVVLDGKKLVLNRDFKVSYKNNKKLGKATIIIKGIGNYAGKVKKKFKIIAKLRIAVPDRSANAASGLTRYLRSLGFNAVWVNSAKIDPAKYDGLAIPGDPSDVDPRFYGEKNKYAKTPHPKTEKMQFKLIKKFAKANKPVLGICKGCQIINVAYGGSLHQDLGGYHRLWQTTHIKKGSWLRKKLDATVSVYHYHHQAVKKLAKNFKVMAWSKKGDRKIIEGIEHKTLPVWGIQFHPENSGKYATIIGNMFKREVIKRM